MNWKNIRVYNNSQNNAFEELVSIGETGKD